MIRALTDVLARAGRRPVRVISPPDRSSQILGRAVATALDVDFGSELVDGTFDEPSLVVAFDWAGVHDTFDTPRLRSRQDLILFSYNLTWTSSPGLPPDVVGILAEACFPPWDQRMQVTDMDAMGNGGRPNIAMVPADDRDPAVIARDLVPGPFDGAGTPPDTTPQDSVETGSLCEALRAAADHVGLFGGTRGHTPRRSGPLEPVRRLTDRGRGCDLHSCIALEGACWASPDVTQGAADLGGIRIRAGIVSESETIPAPSPFGTIPAQIVGTPSITSGPIGPVPKDSSGCQSLRVEMVAAAASTPSRVSVTVVSMTGAVAGTSCSSSWIVVGSTGRRR